MTPIIWNYDASFVALAVELDCPYVTADRRLFDRARVLPRIRHLSRVSPVAWLRPRLPPAPALLPPRRAVHGNGTPTASAAG